MDGEFIRSQMGWGVTDDKLAQQKAQEESKE